MAVNLELLRTKLCQRQLSMGKEQLGLIEALALRVLEVASLVWSTRFNFVAIACVWLNVQISYKPLFILFYFLG